MSESDALRVGALIESFPAAVCVTNERDEIVTHNQLLLTYMGESAETRTVTGRLLSEIIPAVDRQRVTEARDKARVSGTARLLSREPQAAAGARQGWDGVVAPVRNPRGGIAGYVLVFWDRSPRLAAERQATDLAAKLTAVNERLTITALEAREAIEHVEAARLGLERAATELEGIFAAIREVALVYAHDASIIKANPAAISAFGFDPVGIDLETLATRVAIRNEDGASIPLADLPVAMALRGEQPRRQSLMFTDAYGRERIVEPSIAPLEIEDSRIGAVSVWHDITEREQLFAALQHKTDELQDADRRKDEFLVMLAHELRNPLAPIRNAVEILRQHGANGSDPRWAEDVIERQVQTMAHLLDDLLDVSRITTGKITLRKERVDVASTLKSAVETVRPLIDKAKHNLQLSLPGTPVYLEGDPTRLAQIIGNLLNNAVKYTPTGGSIELTASTDIERREVVIAVRDSGVGIMPEQLSHVFDLFMQSDRSLDRSHGGLGVGLTIVRQLVRMHGGEVEASSDGPGRGSTFVVRLPRAPESDTGDRQATAQGSATTGPACRVLVVDDNVDAADSLAFLLEAFGHDVRTAHSATEALDEAKRFSPEVVLLDIGLPGMSGYEVARRLRQQAPGADMLLLALTGYGRDEDRQRSAEAGFDGHLVKPVEPSVLQETIVAARPPCAANRA